jgi:hypothetical protein
MDTLALILGLLASALIVTLSLAKSQRTIALISMGLSAVLVGQYLALEQTVATALSAMSFLYGLLVFATVGRTDSFSRAANSRTARVILLGGYTAVFASLNGGIGLDLQLLAYLGSVLMVAVMMVERAWLTKLILLAAGICWTIFQFQTGAYGNLVGQVFFFGGLLWSSWRLWGPQRDSSAVPVGASLAS